MGKDPAFLFYPGDYIGGTMGMTFEEKGAYIDLLMLQFNRGHMTSRMIGQTVGQLWDSIEDKFIQDKDGLYYNERLELEKKLRQNYTKSRNNNLKGTNQYSKKPKKERGHTTSHKEDRNKNENKDETKKEVIYPFDSETFLEKWSLWKDFKKEQFKFTYKNIGEQSALIKLSKISSLNDEIAIKIITQSIENGWKGLFELKDNNNGQSTTEEAVRSVAEDLEREILNSDQEPE